MHPAQIALSQRASVGAGLRAGAERILDEVIALLRDLRGIDFGHYRRGTIERRLVNRMVAAATPCADAYLGLLRTDPGEADRLAANLTIKVSRFYRNAPMFDFLGARVIPDLRHRFGGEPLRAWSAGCAAGEEAWTLAMLLSDGDRVTATDIDEAACAAARAARYGLEAFSETPASLVREYFEETGEPAALTPSQVLRRRVTFLRHDLGSGQPPGTFHVVCCRNVLIYFSRALQQRVMRTLLDALLPGGVLCLGEAEWPLDDAPSLEVVDRRNRIFRRREGGR